MDREPEKKLILTNNRSASRFEAEWNDQLVWIDYEEQRGVYVFHHTEVPEGEEEALLIDRLTSLAFDTVRSLGGKVVPICPLTQGFLVRNPIFRVLVLPEPGDVPGQKEEGDL